MTNRNEAPQVLINWNHPLPMYVRERKKNLPLHYITFIMDLECFQTSN